MMKDTRWIGLDYIEWIVTLDAWHAQISADVMNEE
jgi:hypothetical protein